MPEALPRAARIRRGSEIREMFRKGAHRRTPLVDVHWRESAGALPRVGWVVPKLGHRIVDRNRLKRRVREIGRRRILTRLRDRRRGLDVLIRVRRPAYRASYEDLESDILRALESACR